MDLIYGGKPMRQYRRRAGRRLTHYHFYYDIDGVHTLVSLYMHVWSISLSAARRAARRRIAYEVNQQWPGHTWHIYGGCEVKPLPKQKMGWLRAMVAKHHSTRRAGARALGAFIAGPICQVIADAPALSDLFKTPLCEPV
jgi:hypothetical protein